MAETTERRGASRADSQVGKRARSETKARSRLRSLGFWEGMVWGASAGGGGVRGRSVAVVGEDGREDFVERGRRVAPHSRPIVGQQAAVDGASPPGEWVHA